MWFDWLILHMYRIYVILNFQLLLWVWIFRKILMTSFVWRCTHIPPYAFKCHIFLLSLLLLLTFSYITYVYTPRYQVFVFRCKKLYITPPESPTFWLARVVQFTNSERKVPYIFNYVPILVIYYRRRFGGITCDQPALFRLPVSYITTYICISTVEIDYFLVER